MGVCVAGKKTNRPLRPLSITSERSHSDSQAPTGNATTRSLECVAAAVGVLEPAPIEFQSTWDVTRGGALQSCGLAYTFKA